MAPPNVLVAALLLTATAAPPKAGPHRLEQLLTRWHGGQYDQAFDALSGKPRSCGALLEPWCAYYLGQSLFYAGRFEAAARQFAAARSLDPQGPVAARALGREGEALLAAGELELAEARLAQAVSGSPSAELLQLLGDARARRGQLRAARQAWSRAYLEFAGEPASATAGERLESAGGLTSETLLVRSERLLRRGLAAEALAAAELGKARAADAQQYEALLAIGKALAKLKRYPEAEQAFERAAGLTTASAAQAEVLLLRARAALSRDDFAAAGARFDEFARRFPSHRDADEAAFLWAWASFNADDQDECVRRFSRVVDERPGSARLDDALWYLGFCSRLAGDRAGSDEALERLGKLSPKLAAQALYWRGRNAQDRLAAERLFRQAIAADPFGWYAWLGRERLAELGAAPAPLTARAAVPERVEPVGLREERAAALARLGLPREAREEFEVARRGASGPEQIRRAANLSLAFELPDLGYRLASTRLSRAALTDLEPGALGLLYPRPFAAEVEKAAAAVKLDPFFAWAIMRRESAFDSSAVSPAQAFGLMQLLVPTARRIAESTGVAAPEAADLQVPGRIVPLAAWYLAQLVGRFGHAALGAAAYNGGADAVKRWATQWPEAPLDEFVERIPYRETRHYVKGVLGDYFTYRALWSSDAAPLPFPPKVPAPGPGVDF